MQHFRLLLSFTFLALFNQVAICTTSEEPKRVRITTNFGEMVVELYDETPLHRDNFIDLVEQGFYDSLQFHRIIENFMIQGGDPTSKNADSTAHLGDNGPGYTLPAEIVDTLYHKRGVLAAAREGDKINPLRRSSGSQFYIVQGQVFNQQEIINVNRKRVKMYGNQAFQNFLNDSSNATFKSEIVAAQRERDRKKLSQLMAENQAEISEIASSFKLNSEQEALYTSIGGAPHLDGGYTVFGELISGFEVLDQIAAVHTNENNRPLKPVIMQMEVISSQD